MTDHDRFLDLCAGYALDVLDAADREELEFHLATCAECRDAVARFRDDAYLLAGAAPPARPDPGVRDDVLTEVASLAVLGFWQRAQRDPGLQQRLRPMRVEDEVAQEEIVRLAGERGFLFTRRDLAGVAAASAFWHRVQSDAALRERVRSAEQFGETYERRAEVLRIAVTAGYVFDPEHLSAVVVALSPAPGELSDEDLDQVAAAGTPPAFGAPGQTVGEALIAPAPGDIEPIPGF